MHIRSFVRLDAEAVLAIARRSHLKGDWWPLGRFEAFSTQVAEVEGRVVGFACHCVSHSDRKEEAVLLANLAVDPSYRRRGIGRALLESRLRIAANAGVAYVWTITRLSNEPLRSLYGEYKFCEGKRLLNYYADPSEDGLTLYRWLTPDVEPPWRNDPNDKRNSSTLSVLTAAVRAGEEGDHQRALNLLEPLTSDPDIGLWAQFYKAQALWNLGRIREGALELEETARETRAPMFRQVLGEWYANAGMYQPALSELLSAVPLSGDQNARLWWALATCWERLARYNEARWAYERLRQEQPDNVWVHIKLANAYLKTHRAANALKALEVAADIDPSVPELHTVRGLACWELNCLDEARAAFERALELQKGYAEAALNLAALEAGVPRPRL